MKSIVRLGLSIAVLACIQPSFASTDPSADNSAALDYAALTSVATPMFLAGSGVCLTVGAAHQIVKLVDSSGNALSDLTCDGFDLVTKNSVLNSSDIYVTANKKEIPLVVRKDYLELNQEVQPK